MARISKSAVSNIMKMRGAPPRVVSGLAFSLPTGIFLAGAAIKGVGKVMRDGTAITNPWFFKNIHSGYGKRGIDSDRLGADGLVNSLHSRRRKQ